MIEKLERLGQGHIVKGLPEGEDERKASLSKQMEQLEANYPGGIEAYIMSARKLLAQSQRGENPLAGWRPSVPEDG